MMQRIVLPGYPEQSDQFVTIEVFHMPPCHSVRYTYRHRYSTIVTYSNLWSILLTGICLEVTLCHERHDASDRAIREIGPDGQVADPLEGHRGAGGRIGQTCDRRLPGTGKGRNQERLRWNTRCRSTAYFWRDRSRSQCRPYQYAQVLSTAELLPVCPSFGSKAPGRNTPARSRL